MDSNSKSLTEKFKKEGIVVHQRSKKISVDYHVETQKWRIYPWIIVSKEGIKQYPWITCWFSE